jgi:hypothetical protein
MLIIRYPTEDRKFMGYRTYLSSMYGTFSRDHTVKRSGF